MIKTKKKHEGYYLEDNRLSGGVLRECPVITCSHCQRQVLINPLRNRERKWCSKCDHYLCDWCDERDCLPAIKIFEKLYNEGIKKYG